MNIHYNKTGHAHEVGEVCTDAGAWCVVTAIGVGDMALCLGGRCELKIPFAHSSEQIVNVSLVNGEIVLTDATNQETFCGQLLPKYPDENGNITETPAGGLHPCFWRGQR